MEHLHKLTHAHAQSRVKLMAAVTVLLSPMQCTNIGMPGITQTLEPCVENPPGARLVISKRIVQISQTEIMETTIPQGPHTHKDSSEFTSPVLPGTHWC